MCDTIECKEQLITILNIYIPKILPQLSNYIVKGGRASDYYISKITKKPFIRFTDWDIACENNVRKINCKKVIDYLKNVGFNDIRTSDITIHDGKQGTQIGINCGTDLCFFIDIIEYPSNDPIYLNSEISDDNIRYVNLDYLINDLDETYRDRINNLNERLYNLHIKNINVEQLSSDNLDSNLELMKASLTDSLHKRYENDIKLIESDNDDDYVLSEEEKIEEKQQITKIYNSNMEQILTNDIPDLKSRIEKIIRTKDRYNKFKDFKEKNIIGGKRKRRYNITSRKLVKRKGTMRHKYLR